LWLNNAIDCSQQVKVQFIDGSSFKGSVRLAAAVAAAADAVSHNNSFLFTYPAPVAAPVFHGGGCLNSFDAFTCVLPASHFSLIYT
jgi:hypothetical protein